MTSIRPSEVRGRILRGHEALRRQLDDLASVTHALRDGDDSAVGHAISLCEELLIELSRHIDLEDAVLAPLLRDVDAWGPIRAARLLRHHVDQRAELKLIAERSHSEHAPITLAAVLSDLIEDLRADMAFEERDVLSADLLRDDVTSSGEDG